MHGAGTWYGALRRLFALPVYLWHRLGYARTLTLSWLLKASSQEELLVMEAEAVVTEAEGT